MKRIHNLISLWLLWLAFGVQAQNDLATDDFVFSNLTNNNFNQHASIDFRTFNTRNLAVNSAYGWLNDGGPVSTTLEFKFVEDFYHLDQALDISTSIAATASYLSANASASYTRNLSNAYSTDENTISILIKLSSDYGKYGMLDPVIKPDYKVYLDNGDHDSFVQACGTHFVRQSDRVVRAIAAINIRNLNIETKQKLTELYKGKIAGSYGEFSGSVEASKSIQKLINTASKFSSVEVNFEAIGGGGTPALKPFVENLNKFDVSEILNGLAKFIETGTRENSAPINYYFTSYSQFGLKFDQKYSYNARYIEKLYNHLIKINATLTKLNAVAQSRNEYEAYYQDLIIAYEKKLLITEAQLADCIDAGHCDNPLVKTTAVFWPDMITYNADFQVNPYYIPTDKKSNGTYDKILYGLTVRVDGELLFPSFFNRLEYLYRDPHTNEMKAIPNFVAGERIILEHARAYGDINSSRFLAQLDKVNGHFTKNSSGQVIYNQEALKKANDIIATVGSREYYVKGYSVDGLEQIMYLGRINLSGISPITRYE